MATQLKDATGSIWALSCGSLLGPDGKIYGPRMDIVTLAGDTMLARDFVDSCLFLVNLADQDNSDIRTWHSRCLWDTPKQ